METSYRPDREYVDGEIRERNVGKFEQARVQALPSRVRIPDLAVVLAGPQPDVLTDPPLLVVEILSPADTYSDTQERAQDYRDMGVQNRLDY